MLLKTIEKGQALRTEAETEVIQCLTGQDFLTRLSTQKQTIFEGAPGYVFLQSLVAQNKGFSPFGPALMAITKPLWRGQLNPPTDSKHPDTFFFGTRGYDWAMGSENGPIRSYFPPPTTKASIDLLGENATLLSFNFAKETQDDQRLEWQPYLSRQLDALERLIDSESRFLFGFAHGAAGLLFLALCLLRRGSISEERDRVYSLILWLESQSIEAGQGLVWPVGRGAAVSENAPFVGSLCNGLVGQALVFLEAHLFFEDSRFLETCLKALNAPVPETQLPLSFCCGQAGKVAIVSRIIRAKSVGDLGQLEGSWQRLLTRIPREIHSAPVSAISGAGSLIPTVLAQGPGDAILDYFLPNVEL